MTGRDVKHTLDLARPNRTGDGALAELADQEGRVLITKDKDFRSSHLLRDIPAKMVFITTGNIRNAALVPLFIRNLPTMEEALERCPFIEFAMDGIRAQGG